MAKNYAPAAFLSYAHADNQENYLSKFREKLSDIVSQYLGEQFPIFQDHEDIEWGQQWNSRIEESIDSSTFLILIISPSSMGSSACRKEVEHFLEREKILNRDDLILPVYFIDTPEIEDSIARKENPLINELLKRQYVDWRKLRLKELSSAAVKKELDKLAVQIRNSLKKFSSKEQGSIQNAAEKITPSLDNTPGPSSRTGAKTISAPPFLASRSYVLHRKRVTIDEQEEFIPIEYLAATNTGREALAASLLPFGNIQTGSQNVLSGDPPFQLFRERSNFPAAQSFTKQGLDAPNSQSCFMEMSFHTDFLQRFDPDKSYCFHTEEKTGKTSWLGFLSQQIIVNERFGGNYEPVWVNKCPSELNIFKLLVGWLNDNKMDKSKKPLLIIDNIHTQPDLIRAIRALRESETEWKNVSVYCTFLKSYPDDEESEAIWREALHEWDITAKYFQEERDLPRHLIVADANGKLTQDGEKIISAIRSDLGQEAGELLTPIFKDTRTVVPFLWISSFAIENKNKPHSEVKEWLRRNAGLMTPHELFRRVWGISERYQDILRAAAYFSPMSSGLLVQLCSFLRDESESTIQADLDRLLSYGDLWLKDEIWPFNGEQDQYLMMQDGLASFVLAPKNFSKPTRKRFMQALFRCIEPGNRDGERAAILAIPAKEEMPNHSQNLWNRICELDWSLGKEPFTFVVASRMPQTPSEFQLKRLFTSVIKFVPQRTKVKWAGILFNTGFLLHSRGLVEEASQSFNVATDMIEQEWAAGDDWSEAGLTIANWYMSRKDWEKAVEWWKKLLARSAPHNNLAIGNIVYCLLNAGKNIEAGEYLAKEAVPVEALIVGANFCEKKQEWQKAVDFHERIAKISPEHKDTAFSKKISCYLALNEIERAQELALSADAPIDGIVALANYYENKALAESNAQGFVDALNLWKQVSSSQNLHTTIAISKVAALLLGLGHEEEAIAKASEENAPAEAILVVANHFLQKASWEKALIWLRQAEQIPGQYRNFARGAIVGTLLRMDRLDEAVQMAVQEDAPLECISAMASYYQEKTDWQNAKKWHEIVADRFREHRDLALSNVAQCLIEIGRIADAEMMGNERDACLEINIILANHFEKVSDWEKALFWHQLISQRSTVYRDEALGKSIRCLLRMGKKVEAENLAMEENAPVEALMYAADHYENSSDWDTAIAWHKKVLDRSDEYGEAAQARMINCLIRSGRVEEAEETAAECPDAASKTVIADYYLNNRQYDKARQWWDSALQTSSRDLNTLLGYTTLLIITGDWGAVESQGLFGEVNQKIHPTAIEGDLTAIRRNGLLLLMKGKFKESISQCRILYGNFDLLDKERALEVISIATCAIGQKDLFDEAIKFLQEFKRFEGERYVRLDFAKSILEHYSAAQNIEWLETAWGNHET